MRRFIEDHVISRYLCHFFPKIYRPQSLWLLALELIKKLVGRDNSRTWLELKGSISRHALNFSKYLLLVLLWNF